MPVAHSPYAPTNIFRPEPVGFCDRCNFLYPLAQLVEQRQWGGASTFGTGARVCTRTCLDELQQNGFRTIVIGPDPVPLRNPRPGTSFYQGPPPPPQVALEDSAGNELTDSAGNSLSGSSGTTAGLKDSAGNAVTDSAGNTLTDS